MYYEVCRVKLGSRIVREKNYSLEYLKIGPVEIFSVHFLVFHWTIQYFCDQDRKMEACGWRNWFDTRKTER